MVKTYSKYFIHFDSIINEKKKKQTCFYDLVQLILATTFLWVKSQFCPHIKTDEDVQVKSEGWFVRFWFWFWAWTVLLCQICKQHEMETGIPLLLASWIWYVGHTRSYQVPLGAPWKFSILLSPPTQSSWQFLFHAVDQAETVDVYLNIRMKARS